MPSDKDKRIFLCTICRKTYRCKSFASKHMRNVHNMQLQIPKKRPNDGKYSCSLCDKRLKKRGNLYRHLREVHKEEPEKHFERNCNFKCPEPTCALLFYFNTELRNHIESCHGVNIEFCSEKFPTVNDFQIWKENVEKETNSRYVTTHARRPNSQGKKYTYQCHRSGNFTSKSTGKRKKSIVTQKINGWCPATIEALISKDGVEVKFWKTHFGHTCEVNHLILSHKEKVEIANKLKEGVGFQQILDEVRDSLFESDVRRIHLLQKKDLYNICKSFNISNKEKSDQKEPSSINAWIANMRALGDCPVIFYKEKGTEELTLKSPEIFLVIMTKLQQEMLQCCESSIICVDCIYHINTFSYHLITLMTIDVYNTGCPLAFCVTNRINERTISTFYNSVKATVGNISSKLFMSVDKPLFYREWQNVMGSTDHQLLCSWDIDKSWRRKLEKFSVSVETKVRVYKKLRLIMQEKQCVEFHSMLEDTLKQFEEDDSMKEFATYFKTQYLETCELWANCYRSNSILHSSLILEQVHKALYHCYMEGQYISSIVRVLDLVIGISRDKILEKLGKLPKELQSKFIENCREILKNQNIDVTKPKEVIEKQLKVPTSEDDCYYVNHDLEKICPSDCKPICSVCCICFHKFTCTCKDNFLNLNICEHIHASINTLKDQCTHPTELCEATQSGETNFPTVAREVVIPGGEKMDVSDKDSIAVAQIVEAEGKQATNVEEADIENLRLLLLQKVECIQHMLTNSSYKFEQYAIINEYFDKMIELF